MKNQLFERITRFFAPPTRMLALLCAICATTSVWAAATRENPVTGDTETYDNTFSGTEEWNAASNWDSSTVPFVSGGDWNPALVDNKTVSTSTAIDGWTLRVGAYNGAQIVWSGGISKIQAGSTGCWLTADGTSSITIASFGGNQLEGSDSAPFKLSSAKAGGITWSAGLTAASNTSLPFWYYLKGNGTVVYGGNITIANAQVIKQADITLSGTSQVASKTLVTFGSGTTKTFTADATIKRLNSDGVDLEKDAHLATVNTTGSTTLTTAKDVGTCELVQTSTGIVLYWVDGAPSAIVAKTYKPSININFTHSGAGLTTAADVGIDEYAVPGTSWSNMAGSNGSSSTIYGVDSTGVKSLVEGASVTVSGALGSYRYTGVEGSVDLRYGYIDDAAGAAYETPKVVVDGIPYYKYRLVLYFSNDTNGRQFGHLTVNGTNYKWDGTESAIVTCAGTSADVWGSSSGTALTEGGNYLVFPEMENPDGKLTIVGHRWSGTQRMGVAAIQIIEVKPTTGADDLIIEVSGDTTHTVTSDEQSTVTGTVYLTGNGTLTLDGSAKITATTINVGPSVVLNVNAARLTGTTFTGSGTVVYDGTKPDTGKGWIDSSVWTGTVWVKNITTSSNDRKDWNLALYGNANSTLRFTNVNLYFPNNTTTAFPGTVDLDGAGMNVCDGYGGSIATIARLTGSGTLSTTGGSANGNGLTINDASGFTGTITLTKYKVIIGTATGTSASGVLQVESGKSITVASATAPGGFVINGTLNANGTLASSAAAAVTGSGTVVFGGVPSPTGDSWWKNATWTGTVEIKSVTTINGDYAFSNYGNAGSTVKLTNCSGWLKTNYTCVPALEIGGTFTWNDGGSGLANTFKVGTLKGSGTISIPNQGAETAVWQITDNWSGFTGAVIGNNNGARRVLVFGATLPASVVKGEIYVSEGATLNLDNSSSAWWGVGMGFVVDGTVKASSRSKWGGGTYMTLGDTGVLELLSTSNTDDQNTEMGNITGTGTLKFSSTAGWRSYPKTDANMPATTLTIQTEVADSLILPTKNNGETVIGNLAGSKNLRSDWSDNGASGRTLTVTQSKDTEWQGKFVSNRTTQFNVIAPGTGTPGTLTLSGTQTATIPMQVDGSVKVTGKWVGATTVAGSLAFGGANGTKIQGAVITSSGATLDFRNFTAGATAPISGALTLDANTTIKLPSNVTFPYKLASSIVCSEASLPPSNYTIGDNHGSGNLILNSGDGTVEVQATNGTISGDCTWDTLGWQYSVVPASGSEVNITVSNDGTLTLGTIQSPVIATKATFNVPAEKTLTLTGILVTGEITFTGGGTVVCCENNTLTGTIKGDASITVKYPEHTLPTLAKWNDADWKGTLVLTNCGRGQNENYQNEGDETHTVVRFDSYGSAYSTIRAPGYIGISAVVNQNTTCPATLKIESGEVVEFNHGTGDSALNTNGAGFRFAKLAGTGTLRLDGTSDTAQYIFDNVSEFTGNVDITFPAEGGRKSFLFGATPGEEVMNDAYAANLVILGDMTVGTGTYEDWTWDIPAGIIIANGKTVTLQNGTKIRALGKDSEGTIKVQAGTSEVQVVATLEGVTNSVFNGRLEIGAFATLNINDPSLKELMIPADSTTTGDPEVARTYSNAGTLNLSGCSSLEKLYLDLGEAKTFDFTKVTLPSTCKDIYYCIGAKRDLTGYSLGTIGSGNLAYVTNICYYATETAAEYVDVEHPFKVENVSAGDVWLIRQNGALIKTKAEGTDRTYAGGSSFAGAACWHEWDFEKSTLEDTGKCTDTASEVPVARNNLTATGTFSYETVTVPRENKKAIPSYVHPTPTDSLVFPTTTGWSAALRCSMPTVTGDGRAVGIAFGDTSSGVVGLAAVANNFVELFNWTPANGGTYTALAQLKVENPSDKDNMHIYVLTVTDNYVSLYRDGEFIHTAAFALAENGAITTFMVGNVSGSSAANIPAAVTSGNTGYVDYVRLYDKVLPESDITGLSLRRPFVSGIDLYERTASLFEDWSATDAWALKPRNNGAETTAAAPAADANVTFTADGTTDMRLNLAGDVKYGTLIFNGNGAAGLHQTSTGRIGAEMMVVRSGVNLTVDYNAVNLATYDGENQATATTVGVDQNATLKFDFSDYPFDGVTTETTITLIDSVPEAAYNDDCKSRYSVLLPDTLPVNISMVAASWEGASYKITITSDHSAGGTVYYKEGTLSAGMTVYTDPALTEDYVTKLFAGDTLVIASASASNDVSIDASFNGVLSITRTTVNLTSTGSEALAGKTVTVATGCTLNFAGGEFGAMTLVGPGSFAFTANTTVASLTGSVGVEVEDGVTLTLTSTGFVSGGVTGTGTVKLPAVTGSIDFNAYGNAYSTVEVTGVTDGVLAADGTCAPTLLVSSAAAFTSVGTYTFKKITGNGNLTFPSGSTVTIDDLVDYTGTIANGSSTALIVTKLTKTGIYVGGDVLLTKSAGTVNVVAVEIIGVEKQGFWDGNDFYMTAAVYNNTPYMTVAAAIAAAETDGADLSNITVLEASESLGPQYGFVTENNVTTVVKKPFAVVVSGTPNYYTDVQDAVYAAAMTTMPMATEYSYIEVLVGGNFDIPLNILPELRIKNTHGAILNFTGIADDCTTTDPVDSGLGYSTYAKINKATVYTWTGNATVHRWGNQSNWTFVNNNDVTVNASRAPGSGDTVVFDTAVADLVVGDNVSVAAIRVGAAVTISTEYSAPVTIAATDGIVLTDSAATLTLETDVTLSSDPATTVGTTVENSSVKHEGSVYSVVPYNTTSNGGTGAAEVKTVNTDPDTPSVEVSVELTAAYLGKLVVPSNVTKLEITGGGSIDAANIGLFVTYGTGGTTHYGILKRDGSTGALTLDDTADVGGVKVKPEPTADEPIAVAESGTPTINIKAIPGLWYVVKACSDPDFRAGSAEYGKPKQAESGTVSPVAPDFTGTVQYYKVSVGRSAAEATAGE